MRTLILATLATLVLASPEASAACVMSYCKDSSTASTSTPTRSYITNTHRQNVGDLYDPGYGRRLQIRNNHRQIIGYIEHDGTVTNTSRQPVAEIELD